MARECQLGDVSSKPSRGFGMPSRNVAGVIAIQSPRPWDANQKINYSWKVQRVLGNINNCTVQDSYASHHKRSGKRSASSAKSWRLESKFFSDWGWNPSSCICWWNPGDQLEWTQYLNICLGQVKVFSISSQLKEGREQTFFLLRGVEGTEQVWEPLALQAQTGKQDEAFLTAPQGHGNSETSSWCFQLVQNGVLTLTSQSFLLKQHLLPWNPSAVFTFVSFLESPIHQSTGRKAEILADETKLRS